MRSNRTGEKGLERRNSRDRKSAASEDYNEIQKASALASGGHKSGARQSNKEPSTEETVTVDESTGVSAKGGSAAFFVFNRANDQQGRGHHH